MITLQKLSYFREIALREHLTKTADELYVSQTTLSAMLGSLEKELGVKLFSRSGRGLQLNEAGKIYLKYVNDAFTALETGQATLSRFRGDLENTVTFCMSNSVVWKDMIYGFRKQHPNYTIRQQNFAFDQFRTMLDLSKIDFAIVGYADFDLESLSYDILRDDPMYVCVSKKNPLSTRKSLSFADLAGQPIISQPSTSPFRLFCDSLFQKAGIVCNTVLECDYTLRKDLVSDNYGIALTTEIAYKVFFLGEDNIYIRLTDEFAKRRLVLVRNPNRYLSEAALAFRKYLINYAKESA